MIKKILVVILALAFAFSMVACGNKESGAPYKVTQETEVANVTYNEKELKTTFVKFGDVETPENLYLTLGEIETGKTDVSFIGKVKLIDGNIVVGIKTGSKPLMAGIYVDGFGFFFVNGEIEEGGEYGIAIKNIPVGTYRLRTFSIIGEEVVLSSEGLSFTRTGAVVLEGETDEDFTLEFGTIKLNNNKYVCAGDEAFATAKGSVFETGDVTASIKGDAGIVLAVYGTKTSDISKASYVYVGVKDGKAVVIDYVNGKDQLLGENAISGYSDSAVYSLKVSVSESQIKLYLNDSNVLTVEKAIVPSRNLGFKCLSIQSEISNITYPECTLEKYKNYALAEFNNLVNVNIYDVTINGLTGSSIAKVAKNYTEIDETIAKTYQKAITAVNNASDLESAKIIFDKQFNSLSEKVLEIYQLEAYNSIYEMVGEWYSIIDLNGEVSAYPAQDKKLDGVNDVSLKVIVDPADETKDVEMHFNLGIYEALDKYTYDHRWWIPQPLQTPTILSSAYKEISACNNKLVLDFMYEEYYDALLRSVCQKALEVYHAIKYTERDGILWGLLWNYFGDPNGGYSFEYDGPVPEFQGKLYNADFRLSSMFYKPLEMKVDVFDIVSGFNSAMQWLSTGVRPW